MHYLRDLIEAHSYLNRIPDQSLVVSNLGSGLDYVQATRASDGKYALIYIPGGTAIEVDLTKYRADAQPPPGLTHATDHLWR